MGQGVGPRGMGLWWEGNAYRSKQFASEVADLYEKYWGMPMDEDILITFAPPKDGKWRNLKPLKITASSL